ncbi:MAG TPA: radical SAM protein [Candidatus Marinimicrobia bacterium]|nr:radical SAM protein [Candidatus Neomarinimicrobiota bacterium]HRS52348.1 radical SAM protein [Candidatus Neomarinimicrobiota bacterium]HRU93003.1 radical SAM protein [Candidatus Neomarinimicrobiota bacterium]
MPEISPSLVVSDGRGRVFELKQYQALGISGENVVEIPSDEWILLLEGSQLMELPSRLPVGKDRQSGAVVTLTENDDQKLLAVAAFVAPAYTIFYHAAWEKMPRARRLPLFAYSAVGWFDGRFYVPAVRIDPDIRQDPPNFNRAEISKSAQLQLKRYPHNRLVAHLVNNCALTYGCPAALNYLLHRWEMPLPTARTCNSACLGCLSLQQNSDVCSAQHRLTFTPTAEEIIETAVPHLETAPEPVASFGQGCEGEPLMNPQLLYRAIEGIRQKTARGTINLNSNASRPDVIKKLIEAGLDSLRVSLNSARPEFYTRYFRPRNYTFDNVLESIRVMKNANRFVSINYFTFPGFSDQPSEIEAFEKILSDYEIDLIQWRNLNIDPEWYWEELNPPEEDGIGIRQLIEYYKAKFPRLRHGYFNPSLK